MQSLNQKCNVMGSGLQAAPRASIKAFTSANTLKKSGSQGLAAFRARKDQSVIKRTALTVAASAAPAVSQATKPMDIVFISAEVAPWSKTGGLGDVVGSLPVELAKRGHNVFTIAPRYDQYWDAWDTSVVVNVMGEDVHFFHSVKQGVHRVWIDHPWFLAKVWGSSGSKLYGSKSGADFIDNPRRFALFCKSAIESLRALPFMPGEDAVIVANDWHTSLVPVMLKDVYQPKGEFENTKVALTIHNIAFQGRFWPETFAELGLPASSRSRFDFEDGYPKVFDETCPADEETPAAPGQKFPKVNWLRAGVTATDKVLTVSPNYALEITSGPQMGVELDGVIKAKGIEGIVNGMDVADWNPALDKFLAFKYNAETVEAGKSYAKAALQRELGLPVDPKAPLFGFIGRLEEQKGVDILIAALAKIPKDSNIQVAVLGTGKAEMEAAVRNLSNQLPGVAAGRVVFSAPLAHLITAGADYMLVPSRFEPCGLIQLHAMAYGTVPLVASTGGLVDTVKEGVTGFQMGTFNPDELDDADADAVAATISKAAEVYGTPSYASMRDAAIAQDLSWAQPAKKWEAILAELKFGISTEATEQKGAVPTPVAKLDNPGAYPEEASVKPSYIAEVIAKASKAASSAAAAAPAPTTPLSPATAAAVTAATATTPATSPAAKTYAAAYPEKAESKVAAVASVKSAPAPIAPKPAGAAAAKPSNGAANGAPKAAAPATTATPVAKSTTGTSAAAAPAAATGAKKPSA